MAKAVNLFAQAKKVETPAPKAKKDEAPEVVVPGLQDYAVVCDLIKNLEALKDTLRAPVENAMRDYFRTFDERPENFKGKEGIATASCMLQTRASSRPLNDAELELVKRMDLPVEEVVTTESRYFFNPEVLKDQKRMEQISKALSAIPGCEDIILFQEEAKKTIVTDATVEKVFEAGLFDSAIDVVGVLAIKPVISKTEQNKVAESIKLVQKLLAPAQAAK